MSTRVVQLHNAAGEVVYILPGGVLIEVADPLRHERSARSRVTWGQGVHRFFQEKPDFVVQLLLAQMEEK